MGMAGNPRPDLPRTCARGDGRPKRTFMNEASALAMAERSRIPLAVYHCPNCGCWHMATALRNKATAPPLQPGEE